MWERWAIRGAAVLLLVFAIGLTVWGIDERNTTDRLDQRGVEVPATVVRSSVDDSGDSTTSRVVVHFTQRGDAQEVTTTELTYFGDFEADYPHARRDGVRVEYDPDDPHVVRLAGDDPDRGTELLVGAGVAALVGVGLLVWAIVAWRRDHRSTHDT